MTEEPAKQEIDIKKKRPWWKRILRILGSILLVLLVLFLTLVLIVRSPWGQDFIVNKATNFVSEKTKTKVEIEKLFITFGGSIDLRGLYLEDTKGDTLIYSEKLQVEIPIWPIITGNPISIDGLEWTGLRANVYRKDSIQGFNYQFIIDAFASDTTATAEVKTDTTSSEPPEISVGSIDFFDFKVNYNDEVTGMKAKLNLGKFHFEGKNIDLKEMKFEVEEMALENTKVNYIQSKPIPPSDTTESELPYLSLNNLKLNNVIAHYESVPDSMVADIDLSELLLQVPKADLTNQNIKVGKLMLNNSNIQLTMGTPQITASDSVSDTQAMENTAPFVWPEWNVEVESIALQKNNIHYQAGRKPQELNSFNPNYIVLSEFNFNANDIILSKEESAKLEIEELSFKESSGLTLKQLKLLTTIDPTEFSVDDLVLKTGNSSIDLDLNAKFTSLENFMTNPEESPLALNLKEFVIDLNDAFTFAPELKENEYIRNLAKNNFTGEIKADGKLTEMELSKFIVHWGKNTEINTNGQFKNLLDTENLFADINNFKFHSTKSDITSIISEADLGISIPKDILVESQIKGALDDIKGKIRLTIPEGKINIDGQFSQRNDIAFKANINVIDLALGKILNNPQIGTIAFKMDASGKGNDINDLNAKLTSKFSQLEFNGYDFSALEVDGLLQGGKGDVNICYEDDNLDLKVDTKIELDSIYPKIALDLKLEGADLYALGITEKKIRTKLMMEANFEGNADQFNFNTKITEGVAVYDNENYYLGPVGILASVATDSSSMDLKSNFLNAKLRANAGIDKISLAIQHHLEHYFLDSIAHSHDIENPVNLSFNMKLAQSKLISQFLVPDINAMDTLELNIDFNQEEEELIANLNLPFLDYADNTIDSLNFNFDSSSDEGKFKFGFIKLNAGPLVMHRTYFDGNLQNEKLDLHFHALDEQEERAYFIETEISGKSSNLKVHIKPDTLIFSGNRWTIPEDNQLRLENNKIIAQNFVFNKGNESVKIANDLVQSPQNNIGIGFENFKLANVLALFNEDNLLASGNMQGNIVVIDPLENFGLNVDFGIENLTALQAPLGKLDLKAKSDKGENYNVDLTLKGNDVDLAVKGDYSLVNIENALDFQVDLNKIGMETIAIIAGESLDDASGYLSAKISLNGSTSSPDYKGYLQFNDAAFNVTMLDSKFTLAKDKISIDNSNITMNNFTIEDEQNNSFKLGGSISTKDMANPDFDLTINAKNFQPINSTKKDNEEFYGILDFDMDGTIKGNLNFPVVDMKIAINENTNFTYALLDAQASIEKSEGIVEFVNKDNPDNILTGKSDSTETTVFGGIELSAGVIIEKGSEFNVIVDPKTGDDLNISGEGDLDFNIARNGRTTLSGLYEINKGHYNLSLYNLVKRQFKLEDGSTVRWSGTDPMDAELNVTAKYIVETSASALMASQTAGASDDVKNKYRQSLPFFVYLNVKGEIDQPLLTFNLGMPEDSRNAIDGTVYARIKQLNSEEDALNKQVFSLLVLKKFYPNAGSDGSGGGTAALVKKNINQAISDQLNTYSNKLMGNSGVELNFGLNSYTDYQGETAEERTDLNVSAQKKLLDDRLIVQVGSTVNVQGDEQPGAENSVVGNASIQYLLTEDGRWRLKGFRDSEYENVIDGQVFVNGISIIFQRQFNQWNKLFGDKPDQEENEGKSKSKNSGTTTQEEKEESKDGTKSNIKEKN
ncbi:translocation/assembly module TamB domain-containing protein [Brumimicrobium mesophilum]|uniref:translocation/assembly module TamB domain-containing protein n=1 Tax=Brumimicrobium mesophilum TaxID=392717 RepID=UPI000D1409F0|nr:translocation/assembly module TamB [Brumimicrobium mesophilum]